MATLIKHPGSPYWYVCYQKGGRTVRQTTKVRHLGKENPPKGSPVFAILTAIERRQAMSRFGIEGPESCDDKPIAVFGEEFVSAMTDRRPASRNRYRQIIESFSRWAAESRITTLFEVNSAVGSRYFDAAKRARSPVTVRQEMALLAAMMEDARRKHHVMFQDNPFRHKISVPKTEEKPFTQDEILLLLSMPAPAWAQLATRLSLYTGARGDSIRHLRWEDINWDKRTIYWPKTKTDAYASPMPDLLVEYLRPLAGTGLVIPRSALGKSGAYFSAMWKTYAIRAGVQGAHFHRLRHTYNTALAHAGVDQATRQLLCHHKTASINAAYTHADAALLVPAVASLSFGVQNLRSETVSGGSVEACKGELSSDSQSGVAIGNQGVA